MTSPSIIHGLPNGSPKVAAFTRTELLVVLATLALLAAVTRSVWGNSGSVESLVCLDNLRRLAAAWRLYADDNNGEFVGNYEGGFMPVVNAREKPWITGWLDWSQSSESDNTNTVYLTQTRYANLVPYGCGSATLYRCPADHYLSPDQVARGWRARVRSYSMNACFGEGNQSTATGPRYIKRTSWSDFRRLGPQEAFVFLEEHPDSINDGAFFPPVSAVRWMDLPGSYHEGAGWLTFADGHLEQHRWQSPTTLRSVRFSGAWNVGTPANDPDLTWVSDHTYEPLVTP